jgi:hypothetical protein
MLNRTDRILGPRLVMTGPEDIRFKALAATIQQRDAPEELAQNGVRRETVPNPSGGARRTLYASKERANFWKCAFFVLLSIVLVWIVGVA